MTRPDFEKLCGEYGVEINYSSELQIYLLGYRGLNGKLRSIPLALEALEGFTYQEVERLLALTAFTDLLTERG